MNCPICEQEFYGVGFIAGNKTLCRDCVKEIMDNHYYEFIGKYVAVSA